MIATTSMSEGRRFHAIRIARSDADQRMPSLVRQHLLVWSSHHPRLLCALPITILAVSRTMCV